MGQSLCKQACAGVENGPGTAFRLSVIIPALDESSSISAALASVRSAVVSPIDVVVVDGGSTDDTILVARRHGAKVIRSPPGRGRQLNAGWRATRGDWCLFLHSDSKLPPRYDELVAASIHKAQMQLLHQQQRQSKIHGNREKLWAARGACSGSQMPTDTSYTPTSTPVLTISGLTRTSPTTASIIASPPSKASCRSGCCCCLAGTAGGGARHCCCNKSASTCSRASISEVTAHTEAAQAQRGVCSVISRGICPCCKNGPCWGAGNTKETVGTQIGVDKQEPPSWQCTGGIRKQGLRPGACIGGSGGWAARWTGRGSGHGDCSGADSLAAWTPEGHLSSARGCKEAAAAAASSAAAAAACSTQMLPVWGTFATIQTDLHNPVLRTILSMGVELRTRWLHRPYGDQALFIRRDALEALSGFKEWPLLEDLEMVERLSKDQPPVIVDAPLFTSGRRWQSVGFMRTTLINQAILICYALGVSPEKLAGWYRHAKEFGVITKSS